jgi:hypothetical protein
MDNGVPGPWFREPGIQVWWDASIVDRAYEPHKDELLPNLKKDVTKF